MNIGLIGCTGLVGRKIIEEVASRFPQGHDYFLFASEKSQGLEFNILGKSYEVEKLTEESVLKKELDLALFSAGGEISKTYAPILAARGVKVIDNSSHFRLFKEVPLVIPEINEKKALKGNIIANPNCSTIILALCVFPLKIFGLKRVITTTYQAVSGAGRLGLEDLSRGERDEKCVKFPKKIYGNCIPQIGEFNEDGYSEEELKIIFEMRKILDMPKLSVTATAVRVPVKNCHAESVNVEFESEFELKDVIGALKKAKGVKVCERDYPTPLDLNGKDYVAIGRIRRDSSVKNGIAFWVVGDNLKKGAAQNAVQIGEFLLKNIKK